MNLPEFLQTLTIYELLKLRDDAIRLNDKESKKLIDEEFKRRDKK